jgi:uncharacterized protein (DUF1501 family)
MGSPIARRTFLRGTAAAFALLAAPRTFAGPRTKGRFVFVFAEGGWDPLCCLAPKFGAASIEMGAQAAPFTAGNLHLVDGPARAPVRAFFANHHARTLVVNGMSTRSVSHEVCTEVALTGSSSGVTPDFPSLIADQATTLAVPSLVLSGPSFPAELESIVSRSGDVGQLARLADGTYFTAIDRPASRPVSAATQQRVDALVRRRAGDVGDADLAAALARAERLKALGGTVDLYAPDLPNQVDVAVAALAKGVSRCVSIGTGFVFDSHNDITLQDPALSTLFGQLDRLVTALATTPSPDGGMLGDDTHVVVLSEMGRTPRLNAAGGRDHWPFTSALVVGPGITGDRQVGAFDDRYVGVGLDPATGDTVSGALALSAASFGATLLILAGLDPATTLPTATPVPGLLR